GNVVLTDFFQTLNGTTTVAAVAGVATFTGLSLNHASSFEYLYATSNSLSSAYTNDFNVVGGAATMLVDDGPADDVVVNQEFTHNFKATDDFGNVDSNFNDTVTLSLHDNPTSATLGGTLIMTASNGYVSFPGLTINTYGTGYTLQASDSGVSDAISP